MTSFHSIKIVWVTPFTINLTQISTLTVYRAILERTDRKEDGREYYLPQKLSPKVIQEIEIQMRAKSILFSLLLGLSFFLPFQSINKPLPGLYSWCFLSHIFKIFHFQSPTVTLWIFWNKVIYSVNSLEIFSKL